MSHETHPTYDASGLPVEANPEGPMVDISAMADEIALQLDAHQIPDDPAAEPGAS